MRRAYLILLSGALLAACAWTSPAAAQALDACPAGQLPAFRGGFAVLKSLLADWQGEPVTCEFADPDGSGDVLQRTTTGLAFWRASTNTPSFTNGTDHWALASGGLVHWTGSAVDPPPFAQVAAPHPCLTFRTCSGPTLLPPGTVSVPPPVASAGRDEEVPSAPSQQLFQTRNGPRTAEQLRDELLAAGYTGPWDVSSMVAAYQRALTAGVPPYPSDTQWMCLAANPSCQRDPWWLERNELQMSDRTTYSAIGERFATEQRFVEAVNLLWQWPEGKVLLKLADEVGIQLTTADFGALGPFAAFNPARRLIAVSRTIASAPTWLLADVIVHELAHVADEASGRNSGATPEACISGEIGAFSVERRFVEWLSTVLTPPGPPLESELIARVSPEHARLARNVYRIRGAPDIPDLVRETYSQTCRRG